MVFFNTGDTLCSVVSVRPLDAFPGIVPDFPGILPPPLNKENNPWLFQSARNAIPQCLR